ncbi:MAG: spore coat protein [Clostridiales bacterium]|nr:spore coat protein [Clostridiales bacterium]
MASYKKETTLNEKDSLQDMLNLEKAIVKIYAMALTEGSSKCFRTLIKNGFTSSASDQFEVYQTMNKEGYYEPAPADKSVMDKEKDKFKKVQACF